MGAILAAGVRGGKPFSGVLPWFSRRHPVQGTKEVGVVATSIEAGAARVVRARNV
ncbi:hypothetical protein ACFV4I_00715 [Nocardiopsis alba]|uniref:hypothetical protein n=1 Tax=Nocardiopsis alba TaxID=53437 RepID=UPI00365B7F4A